MSAKRILLVTEEWAGSGHRMAAEALAEALIELRPTAYVKVVSGLQTASPALREISRFFYLHMLRYNPGLWQKMHRNDKSGRPCLTNRWQSGSPEEWFGN